MAEDFVDLSSVDLDDVHEETIIPAGTEAKLRIVSFLKDKNKNNEDYIMPFYEVLDDPYCKEFGDYMALPNDSMSPKEQNRSKLRIKTFKDTFDISFSGTLDIKNDIIGKEGWAILGVGKDQDGNEINRIRRYVSGA